jgi:hypothetical protein
MIGKEKKAPERDSGVGIKDLAVFITLNRIFFSSLLINE